MAMENGASLTMNGVNGEHGNQKLEHQELQYLRLVQQIINTGTKRPDRTGVGTLSSFGTQSRWNLENGQLPLLTTKRVFVRGVLEELLWIISGSTNANVLKEKGIHIWDGNSSREFLDSIGFTDREEGDLGPVYGFQWRHFGAEYKGMHVDYTGQGVDQLLNIIDMIKNRPEDRRLVLCSWDAKSLPLMALPPCHCLAQFYVANGRLSCQLYQRSADLGLGVPFNIASYSLLIHMMARVTSLQAGEFIHTLGDAHVYLNHVEPLKQQITREPRPFPHLSFSSDAPTDDITAFKYEHFIVSDYKPHPKIDMEMAV
ncbi:thymidylate synthase [Arctopsyche grandis]|uniref:thymidylate synthase n=1 Tax=Arctopsyche grandis TaxID=121162 RepID=UPI00406D92C0